jgi:hypothetical protein
MTIPVEVARFLSEKRARKSAKRRAKQWKSLQRSREYQARAANSFGEQSKIIRMMADGYSGQSPVISKGALSYRIPQVFSIIDAPEQAIAGVGQFASAIRSNRIRRFFLDHSGLQVYDLAANGLLDLIAVELGMEARRNKRKIRWSGRYPADAHIRRFIQALGIIRHLELEHEYPPPDEAARLRVFDKRSRHYFELEPPDRADFKSKVVQQFADHIQMCLADAKRSLTPLARHKLCEYTGEILDNAQEHADMHDWTIQGYLDNSLATPICEIAIFNFGLTIAETLEALPKTSYTWNQISKYIVQHKRRRWFGTNWTERDLLTLVALQGHVSSKNKSENDTRGNGTVDLIEFFQQVHQECSDEGEIPARMAILSGNSHILFDGRYRLAQSDNQGPKIIAFNPANDLNQRPDPAYVKSLGGVGFPGTIISIRFPLSITSIKEANHA